MEDRPIVDQSKFLQQLFDKFLAQALNAIRPPWMKLIVVIAGVALAAFAFLGRDNAASYFIPMLLLLTLLALLAFASYYLDKRYRYLEKTAEALKWALRDRVQDSQLKVQAQEPSEEGKTAAAQEVCEGDN